MGEQRRRSDSDGKSSVGGEGQSMAVESSPHAAPGTGTGWGRVKQQQRRSDGRCRDGATFWAMDTPVGRGRGW